MAERKSKSGWGGARKGAGRKPKTAAKVAKASRDPLELLIRIAFGEVEASPAQVQAAIAATRYLHTKPGEAGKKAQRQEAAREAVGGRFAPSAPPKLALVK